jgi:hypothetical protein
VALTFTHPFVILAEGTHETHFLSSFIAARQLPPFQVVCPQDVLEAPHGGGGRSAFADFLNGAPAIENFASIRGLFILSDNDDDPSASFKEVCNIIKGADPIDPFAQPPRRFIAPAAQLVKSAGTPPIVIRMIPKATDVGALETLCLQAAARANPPVMACVEDFAKCSKISGWTKSKQDKMKLRAFIAASNKTNPDLTLASLWDKRPDLIPLADAAFTPLAQDLARFEAIIA